MTVGKAEQGITNDKWDIVKIRQRKQMNGDEI